MSRYIELAKLDPQHNEMHRFLFSSTLKFLRDTATSVPTTDTLPPGYTQWYEDIDTNTRRLYINLAGSLFYLEGKNV